MAKHNVRGRDNGENGSSSYAAIVTMPWKHSDCLSMTPAYRTFDFVIDKWDMDFVMCSSYQIERSMKIYRDEVERFLRLGDLKDEDGDSDNNEGGKEKGGTATTPSTEKNATRKVKKKSETTTATKQNNKKKKPPSPAGW